MSTPDWTEVLPTPAAGGSLQEAWFTTYDQPEAGLLVENLLPALLGMSHSLSHELEERTLFFGELDAALQQLRGRLTVISSPPQAVREAPHYPWLWRYVSHFYPESAAVVGRARSLSGGAGCIGRRKREEAHRPPNPTTRTRRASR